MTKELQSSRYIVISFLVREMWNRITRTLQQVKKGETNYSTVYTWKRRSYHGCLETLQNDWIEKNDSIWLSAFMTFLLGIGTAIIPFLQGINEKIGSIYRLIGSFLYLKERWNDW